MGTIWGRSGSVEFDEDLEPALSAVAYFYVVNTTTPLPVYQDGAETTPHEHPVEADGGRWPAVFVPFGSYKVIVKDAVGGDTLFSADNIPNPEPFDETFTVDEDAQLNTGDMWFAFRDGTRAGAVRANGRTIGDASSGGTELANDTTAADLFAFLWNNVDNAICAVSTGRGATAAADFAAHKTITLPDLRGSTPAGLDTMGNSAASRFNNSINPFIVGNDSTPGSAVGENTNLLTESKLPLITPAGGISQFTPAGTVQPSGGGAGQSYTPAGTVQPSGAGAGSSYTPTGTNSSSSLSGGVTANIPVFPTGAGGGTTRFLSDTATGVNTTFSVSGTASAQTFTGDAKAFTFTGTSEALTFTGTQSTLQTFTGTQFGGGVAHNNMQRTVLGTWYIKL